MAAPPVADEPARLKALQDYAVLDTPAEGELDDLAQLAAAICGTPIALVSLVDANRQWFKSRIGLDCEETPRDVAFCAHAVAARRMLVIEDALADPRFATNPLVTGPPFIRFYAGAPLLSASGHVLGTLCVLDSKPRTLSRTQMDALQALSRQVMAQLELRRAVRRERALREELATAMSRAQESEERFRQLADHVEAVFFIRELDPPRFLYVSPASATIWGLPAAEVVRDWRLLLAVVVPEDRDAVVATVRDRRDAYELDYRLQLDGRIRWVRTRGFPVRPESGPVRRIVGVVEDITERKELERVRDDLTHMMVHDLRTPLTAARGALDLLALHDSAGLEEQDRELIVIARRGMLRVLTLVNAILDVSRLEEGAMPMEPRRVGVAGVAREILDLKGTLVRERNLDVSIEVPDGVDDAWADPGLLSRVMQNLIANAVKFTPAHGKVRIAVRAASPTALQVSVTDDGPGIPQEMRSRLFQKFATGKQAGRGSGLGLAFCRLAVEAGGGRIWIEDAPGGGTTVAFTVPRPS